MLIQQLQIDQNKFIFQLLEAETINHITVFLLPDSKEFFRRRLSVPLADRQTRFLMAMALQSSSHGQGEIFSSLVVFPMPNLLPYSG